MLLSTPLSQISGIGPVLQKKLKRLGLQTCRDLIFHFPHRYEDFSNIAPIAEVKLHQRCCIKGEIIGIENRRTFRRRIILTTALIKDGSGSIPAIWFNRPYLIKILKHGDKVMLAGKTSLGESGLYLASPDYEKISSLDLKENNSTHVGRISPVYPETEGLSSRWLRSIIKTLLQKLKDRVPDTIPLSIQKQHGIMPVNSAIWQVHFPDSLELARKAQDRFAFQELFHIALVVLRARAKLARHQAISVPIELEYLQKFVKSLPFKLTDAQKKSTWQILKDLERPRPMNRLLQGDVGSGKTVVALVAALNIIKSGHQVAFMAPTEILSKQHFQTASKLLNKFKVTIGLLTGKTDRFISPKLPNEPIEISRRKLLEKTKSGEIDILFGTHALIQDRVKFGKLALVILDEQHRFGVRQRAKLLNQKNDGGDQNLKIPHLLSMTATPIPRTLALTIYGDLDLSLIDELPRGRKKITTKIVLPQKRKSAYDFIRKQVEAGRQVFVICPRIEKSEIQNSSSKNKGKDILGWAEAKAVKEEYKKLSQEVFADLKVGLLHGKLAGKEKERIMRDFSAKSGKNKIDILVSTSVVEVGVDIPNASVMMIEGAERFGLAQLHQFRGRVGRAKHKSFCLLFTESPAKKTSQRLKALIDFDSGFKLAERDLAIRGPGDFSGTRQWGIPDLVMDSLRDLSLVEKAREAAKETLMTDPHLKKYPLLKAEIEKFRERIHLE